MSKLDELLKELCPDGVEYRKIGELTSYEQPTKYIVADTKYDDSYDTPVLTAGQTFILGYTNETAGIFDASKEKPVIIFDDFTAAFKWVDFAFKVKSSAMKIITANEELTSIRYLYHLMGMINFTSDEHKRLWISKYSEIEVPLPPKEIQEEIVKTLDKFTDYVTELQAELQARKLQYEYYMNDLFNIPDDGKCEYKTVGELFEIKNGLNKEKSAFGKGQPIINFTDVYKNRWLTKDSFKGLVDVNKDEIERYSAKLGDVFFTRTSETKEDIGMSSTLVEDIPNCVFSGFVLRARPTTDLLLPKFCAYYFSTHAVRKDIVRYASFTTRATTTGPKLSKIKVPILPKQEQQRIIDILDRFDVLTNDITSGLPAEIEVRQKQYEYYRDKLLTFKEKEA